MAKPPPFIVFYSFKGGVGRSMALINIAALLAGRGRRVLAIDLDLEAPGISYFLQQAYSTPTPGFLNLLFDFFLEKEASAISSEAEPNAFLRYVHELKIPENIRKKQGGSLRIMPAGEVDSDYEKLRQAIDLHTLYREKKGKPLMKRLREIIVQSGEFDYVLIDSRTGFSDEAGISIRDLGDKLLILHGLNCQNVEGTARFLEQIQKTLKGKKDVEIDFIASPVPSGEDDLCEERIRRAEARFSEVLDREITLDYQIPYHPRLALDDDPAIFHRTQGTLYNAYMAIEERVRRMNRDTADDWSGLGQAAIEANNDAEAILCFREADALGGAPISIISSACHNTIGQKQFNSYWKLLEELSSPNRSWLLLGIRHFESLRDYDAVEKLYERGLADDPKDTSFLTSFARFLRRVRNKPKDAEGLYRRALEIRPQNAEYLSDLATLLWKIQQRQDEAEQLYKKALTIDPKDAHIMSQFATFMWYGRGNHKEAERLYERALTLEPSDENIAGRFANFLWKIKKDYIRADQLYLVASAFRPDNGDNLCNYAGFLLAQHRLLDAERTLLRAWALSYKDHDQTAAEIAFYRGLQLCFEKKPDNIALGYLKFLLRSGFPRMPWSFDEVLRIAGERLNADKYDLFRSLAGAILNSTNVADLGKLLSWREVKERSPDIVI